MSFDRAYEVLIANEGGYSNHVADNGGETKYGISKARYPMIDIKNLSPEQAKEITKRDYWDRFRCAELPWPIAVTLFDCVFNHNPVNPAKWLQTAVGVRADGVIGSLTIAAANQPEDHIEVARDMLVQRMGYFVSLSDWPTFRNGWTRRVLDTMIGAMREE